MLCGTNRLNGVFSWHEKENLLNQAKAHQGTLEIDRTVHRDSDLEFIIYTSGSTGTPKGTMITGKSVLNRLHWMWHKYPFQTDEVCCAKKIGAAIPIKG